MMNFSFVIFSWAHVFTYLKEIDLEILPELHFFLFVYIVTLLPLKDTSKRTIHLACPNLLHDRSIRVQSQLLSSWTECVMTNDMNNCTHFSWREWSFSDSQAKCMGYLLAIHNLHRWLTPEWYFITILEAGSLKLDDYQPAKYLWLECYKYTYDYCVRISWHWFSIWSGISYGSSNFCSENVIRYNLL